MEEVLEIMIVGFTVIGKQERKITPGFAVGFAIQPISRTPPAIDHPFGTGGGLQAGGGKMV